MQRAAHFQRIDYLLGLLKPARKTRIVDVGANPLTPPPYNRLLRAGAVELWGFEPQAEAHRALVENAGPDEHYLPFAVGDGAPAELKICQNAGFTSLLEPNPAAVDLLGRYKYMMKVEERVPVETVRLDDVADLPDFDLLKIDIQGGEQAVFAHGSGKLARALAVITEVAAIPLYLDQPLLDEQMRALRALGFDLHKFMFFKQLKCRRKPSHRLTDSAHHNQLVDGDAVFVRGLLAMAELSDEQLKHLVLLADAVFRSHDLAVVALMHLAGRGLITDAAVEIYIDQVPGVEPAAETAGADAGADADA